MISYENAIAKSIISEDETTVVVELDIDNKIKKALAYKNITGEVKVGDRLVVNTTAGDMSLGTGGQHFIIYNYNQEKLKAKDDGHIMKLRYSPYQVKVMATEEEESPFHEQIKNFKSLDGHPVIVATLHSMLAPIAASLKYLNSDLKINFIMTDGAALPINFSNTVKDLKNKGILNQTITIGHAFGGDFEAINIYTGLIISKEIADADITIVAMGPGIVGSGTEFGFTGVEQGINIDAVNNLRGKAIFVPRISFADKRDRHYGISHHSLTVLNKIINTKSTVVLSNLKSEKLEYINGQISTIFNDKRYKIIYKDPLNIEKILDYYKLNVKTMGRGIHEDLEYFQSLSSVASYAIEYLKED